MTYVIRNWKSKLNKSSSITSNIQLIEAYSDPFLEYPECKIPKLDPLELPNPVVFRSLELTSLLTAQIYYSNFTFLGIDEIQIREIR